MPQKIKLKAIGVRVILEQKYFPCLVLWEDLHSNRLNKETVYCQDLEEKMRRNIHKILRGADIEELRKNVWLTKIIVQSPSWRIGSKKPNTFDAC